MFLKQNLSIRNKLKSEVRLKLNVSVDHSIYQNVLGTPKRVYLLLHGYLLDGKYMNDEFSDVFEEDSLVISPNGPFLVPVKKGEKYFPKFAWYFFDPIKKNYYIDYDPGAKYLRDILSEFNPTKLPVTVIGYSQGGYLAPRVANYCPEVDQIISIASVFRPDRFKINPKVSYVQINSKNDVVVNSSEAFSEGEKMKSLGAMYDLTLLENPGHRIDSEYKSVLKSKLK